MARVFVFEIVPAVAPRSSENGAVVGGTGCMSRVLFRSAGFHVPASWKDKAVSSRTGNWRYRSPIILQDRTSEVWRHPLRSALTDGSAEYRGSINYGTGKAAYETLDYMHDEDASPAVDDRTRIDSPSAESSSSFCSDQSEDKSLSSNTGSSAFSYSQNRTGEEYSSKAMSGISERVSYFSGSDESVYQNSGDCDSSKMPRASAIKSSGSVFDGDQENERCFMESEKPAYVSLVWEAGSKIEGVPSDMRRDGVAAKDQSLSLIIDEDYRARKDKTILHCFWIWSRRFASQFWAWGQSVINSIVCFLWSYNKLRKAFWKQALLGAQIPRRISEAKEVWSNLGDATEGTVWLPREDDAFDIFSRNMSEISKNILQMTAVQGKLAWIRLQQQYYRELIKFDEILSASPKSEQDLNLREAELLAYTDKLLTEAKMNQQACISSQQALKTAEDMVFHLQTQVDELKEEVASRDNLLRLLKKEGFLSSQSLQRAAQALSDAEKKIIELESRVQIGEEILLRERDKLTTALRTAGLHEQALKVAEVRVAELTTELASLKESFGSGRGLQQLSLQVTTLEQELKSRDRLLLEIKGETIRSTEALKLAAQIKQNLNATRQRELFLTQSLEAANEKIRELEEQLTQNVRATRAEQVLKHTQKILSEIKTEVDLLRQGVEARDRAISIMKDEVDMNINLLSNAARDREELRRMNRYVGELKVELESKDAKLSMMREEMALIINLAKKQESTGPRHCGPKNVPSASASSVALPPPVQEPKPKRKTPVRKSRETGTSATPVRKPNGTRRTTRSPPQKS